MTGNVTDVIGQALWYAMFLTPLATIPWAWKRSGLKGKIPRLGLGLVLAVLVSFFLYLVSMAILLRNGLGPG